MKMPEGENNAISVATIEAGKDWTSVLPADLQTEEVLPNFQKFKPGDGESLIPVPQSLAKSYLESQKMLGKKGVIVPDEKASEEDWANFHKALGRPDKPEDYGFKKPDKLPEGMTFNEERTKAFAAAAHKLGLPKKAAEGLFSWWNEMEAANHEKFVKEANEQHVKATAEIKKEWGNDYDANLKKANEIITPLFGEDFNKLLLDTGFNNHPAVVRGMFKAAQMVSEHALAMEKSKGGGGEVVTMAQIVSMKTDPRYWDISRRDQHYVNQVDALVKKHAESRGAKA
ncbi:MAG: hypothetical protein PHT59_07380 [Candidatus Omnitrophica bacterium]|nr:hypothetical protein [Candidatus Omnitrophota bacterium]